MNANHSRSFAFIRGRCSGGQVFPNGVVQRRHRRQRAVAERGCDAQPLVPLGHALGAGEGADLELVEKTLRAALESVEFDFGQLMEKARDQSRHRLVQEIEFPTRIAMDNRAHPTYTLIQIQTPDRLGLLYDLLACLDREGVSIALSRISTQNGAAIDTFYVADRSTRSKITDSQRITALQKHLQLAAVSVLEH